MYVPLPVLKRHHFRRALANLTAHFVMFGLWVVFLPSSVQAQDRAPVVVEMFTSKFCPACPRGDANFNHLLEDNPLVIGLACHVSYFNRPGRADLLSRPFCDARQGVYKLALKTQKIFTPMMIVNGRDFITGLDPTELEALVQTRSSDIERSVDVRLNPGYLDISLPRLSLPRSVDVWLFEVDTAGRGTGYQHYRNVVVNIRKLMRWDGRALNMAFPVQGPAGRAYAVVVQDYKGGIISAGQAGF